MDGDILLTAPVGPLHVTYRFDPRLPDEFEVATSRLRASGGPDEGSEQLRELLVRYVVAWDLVDPEDGSPLPVSIRSFGKLPDGLDLRIAAAVLAHAARQDRRAFRAPQRGRSG